MPAPRESHLQFPRGKARYRTHDLALRSRLIELARPFGVRELIDGQLEISIPRGSESDACSLFGSSLPVHDQEKIDVRLEVGGDLVTVSLHTLLNRCRYLWFSEVLDRGIWSSRFQPIVRIADGEPVAWEALLRASRPDGTPVSPLSMMAAARATGQIREFERRAWETALRESFGHVPLDKPMHINIDVGAITESTDLDELERIVRSSGRSPDQIVIEFLESESLVTSSTVDQIRRELHDRGFRVALDDLTNGHSTLLVLERLRPDIAKLDRELVTGAWKDPFRRRVVKAFVDLCRDLGVPLVVEGIETVEDLTLATELGVELAQGYLLDDLVHESWLTPSSRSAPLKSITL